MATELIDAYLLGDPVSKPDVVEAVLARRSADPGAAPFYRAFESIGTRAADEAFVALRLVLARRSVEDASVRRLRGLAAVARAAATGDRGGIAAALERDRAWLGDLTGREADGDLGTIARSAYFEELGP